MDMLALHEEALQGSPTAYHEFLLRYRPNEAVVYGFVEGKDDPMFYRGLIEQALPEGWEVELIPSGNRHSVMSSLNNFDWARHSKKQICFFIDRDLTEFVEGVPECVENLYVTDKYSIENEALNFGTFKRMLVEIFNVSLTKQADVEALQAAFDHNLAIFQQVMCPIMAQIILWRRAGKRPALNNIDIRVFFDFVDGKAQISLPYIDVSSRLAFAGQRVGLPPDSMGEIISVEQEFTKKDGPIKFIRGKYAIWFLVESVTKTSEQLVSIIPNQGGHTGKPKIAVGHKNAMLVLAPRIRCPESLRRFIAGNFVAHCTPPSAIKASQEKWVFKPFRLLSSIFKNARNGAI